MKINRNLLIFWIVSLVAVLIWSAINPHDYFTWFLEVMPAIIGFAILAFTYRKFSFTPIVYWFIWLHMIVLMIGGYYTYAEVPLFEWLKPAFGWERNNYDKVGHLLQGFVPVLVLREIFIRKDIIKNKIWLPTILVLMISGTSAVYELVEWGVSAATGSAGDSFLGTQGYVWDTQSDMLMCLIGAILALLILTRLHDSQIKRYSSK